MIPIILSGGAGSRLWPLSRGMYPKQMLPLVDTQMTMLQQTVQRAASIDKINAPIVICNDEHRFMVGEQLQKIGVTNAKIILEPEGRNTAPAIALGALESLKDDGDPTLLVMPADHVIGDQASFQEAVASAVQLAEDGGLVTFGVVPSHPETGYGYIQSGDATKHGGYEVVEFKEKPSIETAEAYLESGKYYWNSGIFVFKASVYLRELSEHNELVTNAVSKSHAAAVKDLDFIRVNAALFAESPSISIDYAVMEHTKNARVVPLDANWSDVGSWSALWEVLDKDEEGNSVSGDALLHNTRNCHIYSEEKLVTTVGVKDLVIVATDDAIMVADRKQSQDVKEIVKKLDSQQRSQINHHRKVYRPWGWYDSVDAGDRFQVKRIQVKPGAKLSVQMHNHRAEHWVVVKGVAEVLNGEQTTMLGENESTYIPIGVVHALKNPSETEPLEIIEVQSGSYLGEDDIVRFEDNYGRV